MTKYRNDLTANFVRSVLRYNRSTGVLRWKINRPPRGKKGATAGYSDKNPRRKRLVISFKGKIYFTHRIIYLLITGRWPKQQIDHVNGDGTDNRWHNLRPSTHAQNLQNRKKPINNTSGYKGVFRHSDGYWTAQIQHNKKRTHLGLFSTKNDAFAAYKKAAKKHHKKFSSF